MIRVFCIIFFSLCLLGNFAYGQEMQKISSSEVNMFGENNEELTFMRNGVKLNGYYQMNGDNGGVLEGKFVDGKKEGIHSDFYPSGKLKSKAEYKNGLADGMYREYSEEGTLINEIRLKRGKRIWQKMYYENGNLNSYAKFKDDKEDGVSTIYYENGKVLKSRMHKSGELINEKSFDVEGRLVSINGKVVNNNE